MMNPKLLKPLDTVNRLLDAEEDKPMVIEMALGYSPSEFKDLQKDAQQELKEAMEAVVEAQDRLNQVNLAKEIRKVTTKLTEAEQEELGDAYDPTQVVSAGQARQWYEIATQKDDQPLVDRINALGTKLKQHYNQEQEGDG
jgi:hypothetical protein